jgi:RNA polymerase sigma-70 factor (ECF subfamily)
VGFVFSAEFAKISLNSMNNGPDSNVDSPELCLVEKAAEGDAQARRELFERFRDAAFRVAWRITRREADALDVVQESFIKAFESLDSFQGESSFKTWLLRIVSNKSLDLLRSKKVRYAVSLSGDDESSPTSIIESPAGERPDEPMTRQETSEQIRDAIMQLPAEQRSVFALYASGDYTYGEIAEMLGVPIGTVMSRIFHARKRLQEYLADLAPPERARSES